MALLANGNRQLPRLLAEQHQRFDTPSSGLPTRHLPRRGLAFKIAAMREPWIDVLAIAAAAGVAACTTLLGDDFVIGAAGGGSAAGGGGGTGGTGGTGGAGGSPGDGPQLLSAVPAFGATDASVSPFGELHFDRPVDVAAAEGKVRISSDAHPVEEVAQVEACLIPDPGCIRFVMPVPLTLDSRLPSATTFAVVVDRSLPDAEGRTNALDSSFQFTTFEYLSPFFDLQHVDDELGGIAYVAEVGGSTLNALYATGLGPINFNGPVVERIDLDANGAPVGSSEAATPNFFSLGSCSNGNHHEAYGLDHWEDTLYLSASYCDAVVSMDLAGDGSLQTPGGVIHTTLLGAPDDKLTRVDSTVFLRGASNDPLYYFGSGSFGSGVPPTGVIEMRTLAMALWAIWIDAAGLFEAPFYLTGGPDAVEAQVLYIASGETILKLRHSDAQEVNRHSHDLVFDSPQLRTDSQGRLYLGDSQQLSVFDTAGFSGFTLLARREGFDFRRFDIREDGPTVHVYFANFRGTGIIRHLAIDVP